MNVPLIIFTVVYLPVMIVYKFIIEWCGESYGIALLDDFFYSPFTTKVVNNHRKTKRMGNMNDEDSSSLQPLISKSLIGKYE